MPNLGCVWVFDLLGCENDGVKMVDFGIPISCGRSIFRFANYRISRIFHMTFWFSTFDGLLKSAFKMCSMFEMPIYYELVCQIWVVCGFSFSRMWACNISVCKFFSNVTLIPSQSFYIMIQLSSCSLNNLNLQMFSLEILGVVLKRSFVPTVKNIYFLYLNI